MLFRSWMSSSIIPEYTFNDMMNYLTVKLTDFMDLLDDNKLIWVISHILNASFSCKDVVYPVQAFVQKENELYVYDNHTWSKMSSEQMRSLVNKIQFKIMTELISWKATHAEELKTDNRMSEKFNKAIIKLMNVSDKLVYAMKVHLYTLLKKNIHIDYDFE